MSRVRGVIHYTISTIYIYEKGEEADHPRVECNLSHGAPPPPLPPYRCVRAVESAWGTNSHKKNFILVVIILYYISLILPPFPPRDGENFNILALLWINSSIHTPSSNTYILNTHVIVGNFEVIFFFPSTDHENLFEFFVYYYD